METGAGLPAPRTWNLTQIAAERARRNLRLFVRRAWHIIEPNAFVSNWHIDAICDHLAYVSFGDIRNLLIAMPPRMSKSLVVSVAWPAWDWIDNPDRQFLFASYAHDLALRDATKARRLIESPWYQEQFGYSFYLLADDNQKAKYVNSRGGHRISISVQGKTTGEGGNILVGDDFHNVEDMESDVKRQKSVSWHDNAWRSRTNDPNTSQKVYVGQRSHDGDIYGHVLARERERWVELVMPMEFDPSRKCITYANKGFGPIKEKLIFVDPRKTEGELLNPKRFNAYTSAVEKDNMAVRKWMAQFQQQPEGAGGYILKRGWWKQWVYPEWHPSAGEVRPLPDFIEIVQVYDTAFEDTEEDDFTARLTFGIFVLEEDFDSKVGGDNRNRISDSKFQGEKKKRGPKICALLLDRFKDRPVFPDLREEMRISNEDYEPEKVLIEKKSSGHSLIQEARAMDIPVKAVLVEGDLQFRASISSLPLEQGRIFYISRNWSLDVIDEAARFPNGDHDDQVSCLVMFLAYLRKFYDLGLAGDVEKNNEYRLFKSTRKKYA